MSYTAADRLWDILLTIPCPSPGTSNAWVGSAWANGELIQCKNIYPSTVPSQFLRLNPQTGAVIATVNFPFNGYVIGCTYDGANLWVVQWSPVNLVHCISLAGVEVSSFDPAAAPYSARSIAWDGTNLLVGCNQSSNNTELIKFTTTGSQVQVWPTGSVVGWYMDSDVFLIGPSGSNLYVVDNVGNSIKRLAVGASVTIAQQGASPAVSPDVAEGLACGPDGFWHNGAYASLGVIWELSYGFTPPPLVLHVNLTPQNPPIVVPAQGGSFEFEASTFNQGPLQTGYWVWTRNKFPDGSYSQPLLGPVQISPPLGVTVSRLRTQNVPASWPSGVHSYYGYANSSVAYPAIDSSSFTWSKSESMDGSPWITEASCTGEPFPGEEAIPAGAGSHQPSSFRVCKVSPNPFNPTTTISYVLQAASRVKLSVYDTAGRLVVTLTDGWREAGSHEVTFDGSNLATGLYLYRLNAGNQTLTDKMILLK
jgi:hypothetical protein